MPTALRNIADSIESNEIETDDATVIIGADVYQLGGMDDSRAAQDAVFNMVVGLSRLMKPIIDQLD